jgi:hypothetical protein
MPIVNTHTFRITLFIAKKENNTCNCKNVYAQKLEGCYLYLPRTLQESFY